MLASTKVKRVSEYDTRSFMTNKAMKEEKSEEGGERANLFLLVGVPKGHTMETVRWKNEERGKQNGLKGRKGTT